MWNFYVIACANVQWPISAIHKIQFSVHKIWLSYKKLDSHTPNLIFSAQNSISNTKSSIAIHKAQFGIHKTPAQPQTRFAIHKNLHKKAHLPMVWGKIRTADSRILKFSHYFYFIILRKRLPSTTTTLWNINIGPLSLFPFIYCDCLRTTNTAVPSIKTRFSWTRAYSVVNLPPHSWLVWALNHLKPAGIFPLMSNIVWH